MPPCRLAIARFVLLGAASLAAMALAACAEQNPQSAATAGAPGPAPVMATPLPGSVTATPLPGGTAAAPAAPAPRMTQPPPGPAVALVGGRPMPATAYPQHWDGNYQGRAVLVRASSPACPAAHYGVVEVGDSTLFFSYTPAIIFTTAVKADGTIQGLAGATHLDGKIVNGVLSMTVSNQTCETQYRGTYIWNHSYPP